MQPKQAKDFLGGNVTKVSTGTCASSPDQPRPLLKEDTTGQDRTEAECGLLPDDQRQPDASQWYIHKLHTQAALLQTKSWQEW